MLEVIALANVAVTLAVLITVAIWIARIDYNDPKRWERHQEEHRLLEVFDDGYRKGVDLRFRLLNTTTTHRVEEFSTTGPWEGPGRFGTADTINPSPKVAPQVRETRTEPLSNGEAIRAVIDFHNPNGPTTLAELAETYFPGRYTADQVGRAMAIHPEWDETPDGVWFKMHDEEEIDGNRGNKD